MHYSVCSYYVSIKKKRTQYLKNPKYNGFQILVLAYGYLKLKHTRVYWSALYSPRLIKTLGWTTCSLDKKMPFSPPRSFIHLLEPGVQETTRAIALLPPRKEGIRDTAGP